MPDAWHDARIERRRMGRGSRGNEGILHAASRSAAVLAVALACFAPAARGQADGDRLYWADLGADKIQRSDLEGVNVEDVVVFPGGRSGVIAFALDAAAGKLYWVDPGIHVIRRANLDGTDVEDLVTGGLEAVEDLALDPAGGFVYWSDGVFLRRATLDGADVTDVIHFVGERPTQLALDATAGKLYWVAEEETDGLVTVKIRRADPDGTDVETLVSEGLIHPTDLALDTTDAKLYWSDSGAAGRGWIRRATLDGAEVEDLVPETALIAPWGLALDVAHGFVYWSENRTTPEPGVILRASLADGSGIETVVPVGLSFPAALVLDVRAAASTAVARTPEASAPSVLSAPHPNPFAAAAAFTLTPPRTGRVTLGVYDVLGREAARLFDGVLPGGVPRAFTVTGEGLPPGVYVIRASGEGFRAVRRVVRMR